MAAHFLRRGSQPALFALPLAVLAAGFVLSVSAAVPHAQNNRARLEVLQVRPNFYMLVGAGANITAQIGGNGALLVNAGAVEASDDVVAAVRRLTPEPIRYIIDTSADPDVVSGNEKLSKAGRKITSFAAGPNRTTLIGTDADAADILSHESVLSRMSRLSDGSRTIQFPSGIWPSETFLEPRRTMYFNDEGIEIIHLPSAHTDGDAIVFFRKSDVIVAGNIIDTAHFPVIDVGRGGTVGGEIDALNRIIEIAIPPVPFVGLPSGARASDPLQGGTEIVPGHGRVYRQIDVVNYRDMVVIVRDIVQDMIMKKMTLAQVKAAHPAAPYETQYGATSGPWTTDDFVEAIYRSLTSASK